VEVGSDGRREPVADERTLPRVPASAGALIWDRRGRLLILNPIYKGGWTIPGGIVEADGETPWEACRRETLEETGLVVEHGRLVCVDFLRPRPDRPGGIRFLFDCGRLDDDTLDGVVLQAEEISEHRLVPVDEALPLLSGPVRRRVRAATKGGRATRQPRRLLYLEDGKPVR
jgi:ADP-ribose pyrophosphatase YjhB (NUDIX family)